MIEDHGKTLWLMGVAAAYTGQDPHTGDKISAGMYFTVYKSPEIFVGKD